MKQTLFRWAVAAASITAGLLISSCAYDPYYSDGYGYSGGSYSSGVFISTGDSRWGYDPYCHSYYDYHRRAYYDPYLYSYYPVGYRPPVVYGVPHPHGWRPGRGYCPPPSRVRNSTLSNYRDRASLYRRSNFSWANQARQRDSGSSFQPRSDFGRRSGRDSGSRDARSGSSRFDNDSRPVQRQFPGFDPNRGRGDRDDSRSRSGFGSPSQRSGFGRPQVMPDRRATPDRSQFQGRPTPDRSQFQNRSRENRRPSPSGFNNPVTLSPQRSAPRIERAQQQRAEPRQQARPAPTREFSRPQRSGGAPREAGGGRGRGRGRD